MNIRRPMIHLKVQLILTGGGTMLQYVNGFSGLCNEDSENIILKFVQNEPMVDEHGDKVDFYPHEVASLIMDYGCAVEIVKFLVNVLGDKFISKEEEPVTSV